MSKVFLKPNEGIKVRDPHTGNYLPEDGAEVELNTYWQRRLNDGDIVEVKPEKKTKSKDNDNKN